MGIAPAHAGLQLPVPDESQAESVLCLAGGEPGGGLDDAGHFVSDWKFAVRWFTGCRAVLGSVHSVSVGS